MNADAYIQKEIDRLMNLASQTNVAEERVAYYIPAAALGCTAAKAVLGKSYEMGLGVPRNDKEALRLYFEAAEEGDWFAQKQLGYMYKYGRGVLPDDVEAGKKLWSMFLYSQVPEQYHQKVIDLVVSHGINK